MALLPKRGVRLVKTKVPVARIADCPASAEVLLPLVSQSGRRARLCVGQGEKVARGQVIATPETEDDCAVTAPCDGVMTSLREVEHPQYGNTTCVVIQCMNTGGAREEKSMPTGPLTADKILAVARAAGIVDELDGLPLHAKLSAVKGTRRHRLVIDATEPEIYGTAALAVLKEQAEEVWHGLQLAAAVTGTSRFHIAVTRGGAGRFLKALLPQKHALYHVADRYPVSSYSGGTRRIVLLGAQACLALYHAVTHADTQTHMVLTVAGDAVNNPQNIRIPIGTPLSHVLHTCGVSEEPQFLVWGDGITGETVDSEADAGDGSDEGGTAIRDTVTNSAVGDRITAADNKLPLWPGVTCMLALLKRRVVPARQCTGCGRCAQVCHAELLPYEIMRRFENQQYSRLRHLHAWDCDGCGACSYVCPSGLEVRLSVGGAAQVEGSLYFKWEDANDD
ncbi:MAG: 4Fe-4S dicluster domain-containing protein [Oscillospiraceae bacterium]|nr:4Fe-4S dicluster domain-containing protein [Oscillospiraceae bacterium]